MDSLTLLACSLACGPDSPGLGRWLSGAAGADPLSTEAFAHAGLAWDTLARARALVDSRALKQRRDWLDSNGWQLTHIAAPLFPPLLQTLPDCPGVLFGRGNLQLLQRPQLAMVGARKASLAGCDHAFNLAAGLTRAGFTITSGLALGIDGAAHRGALSASPNSGATIAVLAHGPEQLYPARHRQLAADLVARGGLLLTEFPPGQPPLKGLFPQRNRIISGMSLATLVIEASERSGTLVTARLAAEQGREVFAMPGPIHNPLSRGCHQLLRDGASWLESVDDVLAQLPGLCQQAGLEDCASAIDDAPAALAWFDDRISNAEQLAERSGLTITELNRTLAQLELDGHIERASGGYRRRYT